MEPRGHRPQRKCPQIIACSRTFLAVSEPPCYYEASSFPPYPPTCDDALLTTGPEDRDSPAPASQGPFSFKAFLPGNWHRPQLSGTHWKPQSNLIPGAGFLHLHPRPLRTQGSTALLPLSTATGLEVTELYKRKGCNFKAMSFVYSITKYIFEDLHIRSHCEDAEVPGVLLCRGTWGQAAHTAP